MIFTQFCSKSKCTDIAIGFESDTYFSYVIYHIFGTSELLASIGGFLNLIGGISVISMFEIFFFFGCRKMKRRMNKVETGVVAVPKTENSFLLFVKTYCKLSSIHGMHQAIEGKAFG